MTRSVSDYNRGHDFGFEPRESRWRKVEAWVRRLPPGRLLDIGCGSGQGTAHWRSLGWTCEGTDVNPDAVAEASRTMPAKVCDLNQAPLPYPDGSFDLIFAGEVIEHLVDTDGFLHEVHRCLRPGGHLLLTTPNLASFENRIKLLLGRYPRWLDHRLAGCGHVRAYTPRALKRQLAEQGFTVVRHTGNWVPFVPQSWTDDVRSPWLAWTGSLWPNLAQAILVLARRDPDLAEPSE